MAFLSKPMQIAAPSISMNQTWRIHQLLWAERLTFFKICILQQNVNNMLKILYICYSDGAVLIQVGIIKGYFEVKKGDKKHEIQ